MSISVVFILELMCLRWIWRSWDWGKETTKIGFSVTKGDGLPLTLRTAALAVVATTVSTSSERVNTNWKFNSSRVVNDTIFSYFIFIHSRRFVTRRWSSYMSQIFVVAASSELFLVPFLHRRLHGGLSNALMALIQWHARNFLKGGRRTACEHAFLLGIRTSDSQPRVARVFYRANRLHVRRSPSRIPELDT